MKKNKDLSINIDDLVKKIEKRIEEINKEEEKKKAKVENTITNLDDIIKEIDRRIKELEEKEEKNISIDLDKINEKVNMKISKMQEASEEAIDKTIYDLSEITNDLARRNKNNLKNMKKGK